MGGGGSDYEAQQRKQEAQKAEARNALNVIFGAAPTMAKTKRPLVGEAATSAADLFASQSAQAEANKAAREALYGQVRADAYGAGKRSLDESKTTAARENKFALFAQGLNGGSEDIDQNALLQRTYGEGLIDLGGKADAVRSGLATNDEQTRLGLLQSIDAGMDQGSALSSAIAQMKNGADSAAAEATGTDLGDLFSTAGLLYTKSNAARGRQAAANDPYSLFYGYGGGGDSRKSSGGIVTPTGG